MYGRIRKSRKPVTTQWFTTGPAEPAPPADGGGGDGGAPPADGAPAKDEKQLTQTQVNEIVARESRKAAEKASEDLAKSLGVTVDEAKAIIKSHQDKADAEKSEAQKAREAADKEKSESETAKAEAAQEVFTTRAERALVAAGVAPENEALISRLTRMLDVKPGASYDEIKADVKKVKEEVPGMFTVEGTKPPKTPSSDPKAGGGKKAATEGIQKGMDRAQARYANKTERPKPPGMP